MALRYTTRGADTYAVWQPQRCPVCESPMHNGFQLVCEPGVCMFHETPIRYETRKRKAG